LSAILSKNEDEDDDVDDDDDDDVDDECEIGSPLGGWPNNPLGSQLSNKTSLHAAKFQLKSNDSILKTVRVILDSI